MREHGFRFSKHDYFLVNTETHTTTNTTKNLKTITTRKSCRFLTNEITNNVGIEFMGKVIWVRESFAKNCKQEFSAKFKKLFMQIL